MTDTYLHHQVTKLTEYSVCDIAYMKYTALGDAKLPFAKFVNLELFFGLTLDF